MFIGIDIGTTATKAILIDEAQKLCASASLTYGVSGGTAGHAEQDPKQWIDAVRTCLKQLKQQNAAGFARVSRIGLSGQMHSLVPLDRSGAPLRPALLWNDSRGSEEAAQLAQLVPHIEEISGAAAMPSFTAAKLLWMKAHEPSLFKRIHYIVLPKDFARLWLTGEIATDHSDAAGSQLYDERHRCWSNEICSVIGLPHSSLPPIGEACATAGILRAEVAAELGLPATVEVCFGAADTPVGALGLGATAPGDSFISLGTGALFATITDGYRPTSAGFLHNFAHCLPGQYYRMGAMLNGASSLAWAAQLVGADDIGALLAAVEARYAGPSRIMFIPYLNGERTPHNNAALRGALFGLDSASDKLDIAQAVIEGVAFSLKDALLALGIAPASANPVGIIGGGAKSTFWTRIIASVLNTPLARYSGADLWPALGAARLAMAEAHPERLRAIASKPDIDRVVVPDDALVAAYAQCHDIYRSMCQASFAFAQANAGQNGARGQ